MLAAAVIEQCESRLVLDRLRRMWLWQKMVTAQQFFFPAFQSTFIQILFEWRWNINIEINHLFIIINKLSVFTKSFISLIEIHDLWKMNFRLQMICWTIVFGQFSKRPMGIYSTGNLSHYLTSRYFRTNKTDSIMETHHTKSYSFNLFLCPQLMLDAVMINMLALHSNKNQIVSW